MPAASASEKPVRLIQITDTHLGSLSGDSLLGMNTDESLCDVLQLIAAEQSAFDYLVCTGDIASAGQESCYHRFIEILKQHFSVPLAWLPGNHDSAAVMAQLNLVDAPEFRMIEQDNWQIILLDSSVPGQVYGNLGEAELTYLEAALQATSKHVMIMLHHQPLPVGSDWIDQYLLHDADAFFNILDRYSHIKAVVWGHVHQEFCGRHKHMELYATPSTCIQFSPHSHDFSVDTAMPGYRWFDLHSDGRIETGVSRVTGKHYSIDYKSIGY